MTQGLPRSSAALLRRKGIDAVHVGEIGLAEASDESIIEYAKRGEFAVATLDADFNALLAVSNSSQPSVIRIRVQRLKGPEAAALVETVIERIGHELERGAFITVTGRNIRFRRLPLRAIEISNLSRGREQ